MIDTSAYLWPHPLSLAARVARASDLPRPVQPSRREPMPDQPNTFEARMKIPEEMFSMMNNKSIVTREDVEKSFSADRMPSEATISKLINGLSVDQESQISRNLSMLNPIENNRERCIYAIVRAERVRGHWSPYEVTENDNAVIFRYLECNQYYLLDNQFDLGHANGMLVIIAASIIGIDPLTMYDESYAKYGCERISGAWIEPACMRHNRAPNPGLQKKLAIRDLMRRCLCILSDDYRSSQSEAAHVPGSLPREVYFL